MTCNKPACWLFTMTSLVVMLSACAASAPTPQTPRATDEPVRSTLAAVSTATQPRNTTTVSTVTEPPNTATPTPQNTTTPVLPSPSPTTRKNTALPRGLVLPDLQTEKPIGLLVQPTFSGETLLRFTNTIVNKGAGALRVQSKLNAVTNKTAITQIIDMVNGDTLEYAAGEFIFHPDHNHWHMENFALYEVWSLTATGKLDSVVAFTDKVSYCLQDDFPGVDIVTHRTYTSCTQALQGISVGWHDRYETFTPGQFVDITAVADGVYALRSTVDPANHLQETDNTNNAVTIYFTLEGNRVRVVDQRDTLDLLRLLLGEQ